MASNFLNCYCAFCRIPRKVYRKKNVTVLNFAQAGLIAFVLMWIFFRSFDARVFVLWVAALILVEAGILIRRRVEAECPHCGFDPHLYLKNKEKACEKVKSHLRERQNDINVMLARKPPLRLPTRTGKGSPKSTREIIA